MFQIKEVISPSVKEAVALIVSIVLIISVSLIRFEAVPHIPILLSIMLLFCFGLFKKVPYHKLESGLVAGAGAGMSAVFLFFFIGILISTWMMSGTIPTLIYAGFNLVTPLFFFAIVFVVCSIIGISIGSSLTTVATVGVAFIGMAAVMDISLAITAGAIVSGAFFGDKMSPLSDTTNLASSMVGVDLFEHIRNMGWTTVPAFILSLIFFAVLSPDASMGEVDDVAFFQQGLLETGAVHWYTMIPLLALIVLTIGKVPAMMTLAISSLTAVIVSFFHHSYSAAEVMAVLYSGFVSETGVTEIDALLSRGGMESMLFTIGLVLLALSMGGLLFTLGIVQCLLAKLESVLKKVSSVIAASAFTAIGINILIGEQYLSILLTGQAFYTQYEKLGLTGKNLSRVMEDAGTVVNPLVPWSVCGIFITSILGVSTLEYLPFAFFCLLSPILTVLYGYTGKTLTFRKVEPQ
ncbi:Na+/H+ antiporter NhaC [Planococcus shenhongbingii]|uniref:Na+/H+ antiporter NhaC n=1 Tax=Planococcus shenhongbingii TaxID=3058398 RepID=A0ABT8NDS0_9BACL|nr:MULTISPECIES: Na+/H+ antiporter NhaC [unclassified Planococcus (in: firmicutes)]MDN7245991.1 Na+/H+ antiporter NhaC [Planococcus sp. N017]WKA59878.1 Na+/H+ antiporter NhaC [Planococcus sp. N016]